MTTLSLLAECPKCGGSPEFDEEGKAYTCYFCCDTGRVEKSVADAYYRVQDDETQKFSPKHLGIFVRPMADEYDWEPEDAPALAPGHRLFTGIWEIERSIQTAERARIARIRESHRKIQEEPDDIPF